MAKQIYITNCLQIKKDELAKIGKKAEEIEG